MEIRKIIFIPDNPSFLEENLLDNFEMEQRKRDINNDRINR